VNERDHLTEKSFHVKEKHLRRKGGKYILTAPQLKGGGSMLLPAAGGKKDEGERISAKAAIIHRDPDCSFGSPE